MKRFLRILLPCLLLCALLISLLGCSLFPMDGEHTVTFRIGNKQEQVSVASGGVVSPPKSPKMENRIFSGWYTDAACKEAYDFSTPVFRDKTLYAGFVLDGAALTNAITLDVMPALVTVKNVYRTSLSEEISSQGSGYIYKIENGTAYVITNCHVAYSPSPLQSITVRDFQGEMHEARIYRKNPSMEPSISAAYDLAILTFTYYGSTLRELPLAQKEVAIGNEVISLGSPQNQSHAITYGKVLDFTAVDLKDSAPLESNVTFEVIYHSAAINNGSSGGPLLNGDLAVVGVNYAGTVPAEGERFGKGCAVPLLKLEEFILLYG